jgi:hypothetical protein
MSGAVSWQRAEGALVFLAGLALVWVQPGGLPWWAAVLLFFAPDLGFAAYGAGPRVGAAVYNTLHLYAGGAVLLALGLWLSLPVLWPLGALWLAHCGLDRALGYGLKSPEGFTLTHLGRIGRR